jgi:hypothetical protein
MVRIDQMSRSASKRRSSIENPKQFPDDFGNDEGAGWAASARTAKRDGRSTVEIAQKSRN